MDKLYNTQMELAQQISVGHTRKLFGGNIGLMFYDVTTLYFETAQTDVLREPDFSKDGKTVESQVVFGLLVSEGGYPLSYSLFNGNQYEGFTMIPMIDDFKQRFNLDKDFVVVADSGLMNKNNVSYITNTDLDAERVIAINKIGMSVDKVPEAAKTITTIRVRLPENGTYFAKTLFLTEKHLAIKPLFDLSDGES